MLACWYKCDGSIRLRVDSYLYNSMLEFGMDMQTEGNVEQMNLKVIVHM